MMPTACSKAWPTPCAGPSNRVAIAPRPSATVCRPTFQANRNRRPALNDRNPPAYLEPQRRLQPDGPGNLRPGAAKPAIRLLPAVLPGPGNDRPAAGRAGVYLLLSSPTAFGAGPPDHRGRPEQWSGGGCSDHERVPYQPLGHAPVGA